MVGQMNYLILIKDSKIDTKVSNINIKEKNSNH